MIAATITNKGNALLAKLITGSSLEITSVKSGAGTVDTSLLKSQTSVTTPKKEMEVQATIDQGDGVCDLILSLRNDGVTASYSLHQIGIYANDPDEGEILYAIYQADSEDKTLIPSEMVRPGYCAEWTFRIKYDQADNVSVTLDPANSVTQSGMEQYVQAAVSSSNIKAKMDEAEIITTTGTGAAYNASVPAIKELKAGASFVMIPHVTSTTNAPTLNVNGLGAKPLRQPLTSNTTATTTAAMDTWLSGGKPIRVMYDGALWKIDIPRASGAYLYGTVPVENGGTGASTATTALANLGGQAKKKTATVTLAAGSWVNNTQTVNVASVTANNTVIAAADPDSCIVYGECQIRCDSQSAGQLTFRCEDVPTVAVTVNILIFD